MKIIYIILFLLDTLVLISLSFIFFRMIDDGGHAWSLTFTISGILISICLLIYLLVNYIKIPPSHRAK